MFDCEGSSPYQKAKIYAKAAGGNPDLAGKAVQKISHCVT